MKNYVGKKIEEVATTEEIQHAESNEYGTSDCRIHRNIIGVPADEWIQGISNIVFEFDNDGMITHQIENV